MVNNRAKHEKELSPFSQPCEAQADRRIRAEVREGEDDDDEEGEEVEKEEAAVCNRKRLARQARVRVRN